jgi:hypothetical protein
MENPRLCLALPGDALVAEREGCVAVGPLDLLASLVCLERAGRGSTVLSPTFSTTRDY